MTLREQHLYSINPSTQRSFLSLCEASCVARSTKSILIAISIHPSISILNPIETSNHTTANMHLMYTVDASGKRLYTLKKVVGSEVTKSAHPARFSPDDKYSRHRVTLKKRYGLLMTQQSESPVNGGSNMC